MLYNVLYNKNKNYDIIELLVNEGLNVINEDNTYSKLFTYNGGNQPNTYKLKSNLHSILKNLKEPKSVLNLQIETLLILYMFYIIQIINH